MSDGKELKTWDVRGVMVEPRDFMGEYVLASDHDRIVDELRAEVERLKSKSPDLEKIISDAEGRTRTLIEQVSKLKDNTIATQAREAEVLKAVIEVLVEQRDAGYQSIIDEGVIDIQAELNAELIAALEQGRDE